MTNSNEKIGKILYEEIGTVLLDYGVSEVDILEAVQKLSIRFEAMAVLNEKLIDQGDEYSTWLDKFAENHGYVYIG